MAGHRNRALSHGPDGWLTLELGAPGLRSTMNMTTTQLLKFAGLFTWGCVGLYLIVHPQFMFQDLAWADYVVWTIAQIAFGAAYWQLASDLDVNRRSSRIQILLLALMTISALEVSFASHSILGGFLLLVVAGVLPWSLNFRESLAWLVAQNLGMSIVFVSVNADEVNWGRALLLGALMFGFSTFAYAVSLAARRNTLQRDELSKVNSELRATQALLAQATRISERLRISRDLHDLVGHHLTALTLNLEVASHLVEGKSAEHIEQAKSVAKLLLSDVREVVSSMREQGGIELAQALQSLADGVPRPKIHLEIPGNLMVEDPQRAQVILRCAQEIITNSLKHARAENLWLRIEQDANGLSIQARDDGLGTDQLQQGNGLLGMGERLRQLGGKLSIESSLGQGFSLDAWLPSEVTP